MADSPDRRAAVALGAGAALLVAALACSWLLSAGVMAGWLAAMVAVHAIGLTALILLLMMRLIDAAWRAELRDSCEAMLPAIPLAALMAIPMLIALPALYPWAGHPPAAAFKAMWLSPVFFVFRTLAWFLFLNWLAWRAWRRRLGVALSCAALIGIALGASLILTDWLMSLDPDLSSSGFGLELLGVGTCAGYAAILLLWTTAGGTMRRPALVGALFLTFLLLWAYFQFLTYFITWSGNLAGGAGWYAPRLTGGWGIAFGVSAALGGIPLLALLLPACRASIGVLRLLATSVLAGKAIEFAWFALPGRTSWAMLSYALAVSGLGLIAAPVILQAYQSRPA